MSRADPPPRRRSARLRALHDRVLGLPGGRLLWRVGVTAVGSVVVAIGVLLLPLPGPGWLIIFGGLGVLATEYAWARRLLSWVRTFFVNWTRWLAARPLWFRVSIGLLGVAIFAGIVLAGWFVLGGGGL